MNKNIIIELCSDKWDDQKLHTALSIKNERQIELKVLALDLLVTTKTKSEAFAKGSLKCETVNELALLISSMYEIEARVMEIEFGFRLGTLRKEDLVNG
jgi:hypothetical protein